MRASMRLSVAFVMTLALATGAHGGSIFLDILPPGQDGLVPVGGAASSHANDQVCMYSNLTLAAPHVSPSALRCSVPPVAPGPGETCANTTAPATCYFKEADIDPPASPVRVETPRAGVTVSRDAWDVPHVVGRTRGDVFFGAGFVTAEDRLFLTDIFRHVGRGRASEFLAPLASLFPGGLDALVGMDRGIYGLAGYSEAELQAQVDAFSTTYPEFASDIVDDVTEFTAGMNAYIAEARATPGKMPAEYAAFGIPLEDWQVRDIVAIAVLFNSTFGFGGGGEHVNAVLQQALTARYGQQKGLQLWQDLREADDPEAPVTTNRRFPYLTPGQIDPAAVAIPDPGSITGVDPVTAMAVARAQLGFPRAMSNFLVVDRDKATGAHPIGVMGPQTGYRAPEVLIEMALRGGGVDVRGATFPGIPYVALGHTSHYAWSATSGGSDLADVRVERLCDPPGGDPASGTMFNGVCQPMLRRTDTWSAGTTTVTATVERTSHGNVFAHATVGGQPVALVVQRSTFFREIESAPAFALLDTGAAPHPATFRHAMSFMNATFNWVWLDGKDVAYFHSGRYPIRAPGVDPDLPSWGTGEWEWGDVLPTSRHPFEVNPPRGLFVSWNNKPAPGWRAADSNYTYGPVYRSQALDTRLLAATATGRVDVPGVVDVMADAATVDLRGETVAPDALALVKADPRLHYVVHALHAWVRRGAHRRDRETPTSDPKHPRPVPDGCYDEDAAVALMDAWYPLLLHAVFDPQLAGLYDKIPVGFDDAPGPVGSAYQGGFYGYLQRALREAAGRAGAVHYRVLHCADGTRAGCAAAVQSSLLAAMDATTSLPACRDRVRADSIQYALGGLAIAPDMPWQNRPTFQQVVQIDATVSAPAQ
jgi:acyl-homoserine lactone acylase PvdQ